MRKHGIRVRLPEQPFRVLAALLERPHELVTREDLHHRIWPEETFVDFEQGLNRAVNKLRESLGDSAANPRYIETLPGRGYRFIGLILPNEAGTPAEGTAVIPPVLKKRRTPWLWTAAAVLLTVMIAAWLFRPVQIKELRHRKLTTDNYSKFPPVVSDGVRLYFRAVFEGETFLAQVPVNGGPVSRLGIVPPGVFFQLQDVSPDGQHLLLTSSIEQADPPALWAVRLADGGARKLLDGPILYATYSPQGDRILYSTGDRLWEANADGSASRSLVQDRECRLWRLCWAADGRRIRWTREGLEAPAYTTWELEFGGQPKQLLPEWPEAHLSALGWALGGQLGLFESNGVWLARAESGGFWEGPGELAPISDGEPEFTPPLRIRNSRLIFAIGTDRLGELQKFEPSQSTWSSLLDGTSAEGLQYSPDKTRLLYVSYPQRELWVRQADGSRPVQLTSRPLLVSFARWSPDGKRIALAARRSGSSRGRIYVLDAEGGTPVEVKSMAPASFSDPAWLADGRLVFGVQGNTGKPEWAYLHVANLSSGQVTELPGSRGLYAPRCCSPSGEVAAMRWRIGPGSRELVVLDPVSGQIAAELRGVIARFPEWVPGAREIAFFTGQKLMRWRPGAQEPAFWMDMPMNAMGGIFRAITFSPDGQLIRTLNRDRQQIYELDVAADRR